MLYPLSYERLGREFTRIEPPSIFVELRVTPAERHHDELVRRLTEHCKDGCYPPQTRSSAVAIGEATLALLFPHLSTTSGGDTAHVATAIEDVRRLVRDFQQLLQPVYPN